MAVILGCDPGSDQSACVLWDTKQNRILKHWQEPNGVVLTILRGMVCPDVCVIEDVAFYGKVLNKSTFETLKFIGRIQEIFPHNHALVIYPEIAVHFCNSRRVKTSQINAVLMDRFGGKGTKKQPGVLFGIKEHEWSALSCCIHYADIHK
jgi:hypothetical protein